MSWSAGRAGFGLGARSFGPDRIVDGPGAGFRARIRVMAGASIGMGHVARSASLARALESIGAEVNWACGREAALFLRDRGVPSGRIQIVTDESGASHESQLDREHPNGSIADAAMPD